MIFVSYYYDRDYSKSTYYKDCSERVRNQLHNYGYKTDFDNINFDLLGLNSSYLKLNMIKPTFLLDKLKKHQEPVIWIDADCIVNHRLEEFETIPENVDIAYCIRHHDNKTPHAAVLYFGNTENANLFLREWEAVNKVKEKDETYDCSEHCTLIDQLKETKLPLNIMEFKNIAYSGAYEMGNKVSGVKIWIGISPDAWEYERNKSR
jgi:hypothetical protein